MSTPRGSRFVNLEAKHALTKTGEQFFTRRRIPLHELRLADGRRVFGMHWDGFDPEHLKRLVAYGLIGEIELSRTEFISRRSAVMELTRGIVNGILEKRFRPELKEMIRESPVFAPLRDRVSRVSPEQMRRYVAKHSRRIRLHRKELAYRPIQSVKAETESSREQRKERVGHVRRIIRAIDSETWFLLSIVPRAEGRERLMSGIQDLVMSYTNRFRVVDYLALMLMELLQYAEQTQVWNFAERDPYVRTHPEELQERLENREFREKLFSRAEESGSYLTLSYRFHGNPYNPKRAPRMEIVVTNRGLVGYESRRQILEKRSRSVRNVPLSEFYSVETPGNIDTTLGMHYLFYVEEACRKVGMSFDAELLRDERSEETRSRIVLSM